jgi:uncharacterized protein YjbJ (UPF0337 family)
MNTLEINGDWDISRGKLQQNWALLTHDDLRYVKGRHDEWLGRIQQRTGQTREAIETAIKEVFSCGS